MFKNLNYHNKIYQIFRRHSEFNNDKNPNQKSATV